MTFEVTSRSAVFVQRRGHADPHVARAEDGRCLPAALDQEVTGPRHLVEIELLPVKRPASLEVFYREVK
jgi:hypothetical protein